MSLLEGVILGIVQGVFMFVPVSSTAHLVLTQQVMAATGSTLPGPESPEIILFDVVLHVGTLVSIGVVLRHSLTRVVVGIGRDLAARRRGGGPREGRFLRLGVLGGLTVVVTGVAGLLLRPLMPGVFAVPLAVAVTLVITGAILWWTDHAGPQWRGLRQLGWPLAVAVGLAQALALTPGLSRSGLTIAVALAFGLRRRWAAEYSFLVAIPTILAIALVQGVEVAGDPRAAAGVDVPAFAAGFVAAAVVGAVALELVLALLYRARFRVFAVYVWLVAAAVLVAVAVGWLPTAGPFDVFAAPTTAAGAGETGSLWPTSWV